LVSALESTVRSQPIGSSEAGQLSGQNFVLITSIAITLGCPERREIKLGAIMPSWGAFLTGELLF
jgi:hypothetical protein